MLTFVKLTEVYVNASQLNIDFLYSQKGEGGWWGGGLSFSLHTLAYVICRGVQQHKYIYIYIFPTVVT